MTNFPVLTADSIFEHARKGLDEAVAQGKGVLRQEIDVVLRTIADRECPDHPHSVLAMPDWWQDRHNHPEVRKAFRLLLIYAATTYDHCISPTGGITWLPHSPTI